MNGRFQRLLPLGPPPGSPGATGPATGTGPPAADPGHELHAGAKAARLAAALRAGFPVLPGWVVPCAESRPAVQAGAAAVRQGRLAAGRRAAATCPPDPVLAAELREAVRLLGGRVIVRSSSPLESDPRWSGAFSSVAEVGPQDVATAVRSCWASAFAVDPLDRLDACGLPLEALELGVLIQPEIRPEAGGTARVTPDAADPPGVTPDAAHLPGVTPDAADLPGVTPDAADPSRVTPDAADPSRVTPDGGDPLRLGAVHVVVEGVAGHPGALLSGWADGAVAQVRMPSPAATRPAAELPQTDGPLAGLLGRDLVTQVARLAEEVYRTLGDTSIEWAVSNGTVWLLQSLPAGPGDPAVTDQASPGSAVADPAVADPASLAPHGPSAGWPPGRKYAEREWMPVLAAAVLAQGCRVPGRPGAAGQAAGRLVPCSPHERPPAACRDAILLVDRPVPALAPLLFAARGVIARSGAAGSHLAEVARSLAVPMVTGCHPEAVTGTGPLEREWLAAIDGATGEVALLRSSRKGGPA